MKKLIYVRFQNFLNLSQLHIFLVMQSTKIFVFAENELRWQSPRAESFEYFGYTA